MIRKAKHIHFMGIGGSGMSAVALIAHRQGYKISGCDLAESTPYLSKVKKLKIPIFVGHDSRHLDNVDVLTVTPAAFFQNEQHSELILGEKLGKLMTWQKFLGKYLHKNNKVICIAGTHGKSTTTAMASLLFEEAGKDPSVMIGATIKKWRTNYRFGKSRIFITEADEFFDNFLNYEPETIVLNNIELDHPDFFTSEKHVIESFAKFINNLVAPKTLIVNQDSPGIEKLFKVLGNSFLSSINVIGYSLKNKPHISPSVSVRGKIVKNNRNSTIFQVSSKKLKLNHKFKIEAPGEYNVANALGVIILAKLYKIETNIVKKSLSSYSGIERRLELIGTKRKIKVYDDYAHHPTAISATLGAFRQQFPKKRIWAVIEPHSYSRTKTLLKKYKRVFDNADGVIVGPIFKARDDETFGVSGQSIVDIAKHSNIKFAGSQDKVVKSVRKLVKPNDVIIVMGAGLSYKWSKEIFKNL